MVVAYLYKQDVGPFCFGLYIQNGVAQVKTIAS
jgi:hypothetical protein